MDEKSTTVNFAQQRIKKILTELIAIPSVSGHEDALAEHIRRYFSSWPEAKITLVDKNVVVHIPKGSDTLVIFNAHMDTVPLQEGWTTDPYTLTEKGSKWFGLGISDEKVSSAILMDMMYDIAASPVDLMFQFVVEEETGGRGSEQCRDYLVREYISKKLYKKMYCVICEPRDANRFGLGNKGNIFFKMHTKGVAAHSSVPEKGKNAIIAAYADVAALHKKLATLLKKKDVLGPGTFACPTMIAGGSAANAIPSSCTITGNIRTNTKNHDAIIALLKKDKKIIITDASAPCLLDGKTPFAQLFKKLKFKQIYTPGANDAHYFAQYMPTIVHGAGTECMCHKADEYCIVANIEKTRTTYFALLREVEKL